MTQKFLKGQITPLDITDIEGEHSPDREPA